MPGLPSIRLPVARTFAPDEAERSTVEVLDYCGAMAESQGKEHEEIWIGSVHVANIREENGHGERPFLVESVNGKVLKQLADRHTAEVWISMHSDEITERELG